MATKKSGIGILGKMKRAVSGLLGSEPNKPAEKVPAKNVPAKKTAVKKTAAKKTPAKKAVAKRSSTAAKSATSMDRKLIALSEPYEVRDWCKSLGCSEAELKAAVKAVGNSAAKVKAYLSR